MDEDYECIVECDDPTVIASIFIINRSNKKIS